jgi:hypothetical protein
MSTKDPKAQDEQEQNSGGVVVAEKPTKKEFEDHDRVTVLYGWNKVPANSKQFVDKVPFIGGVARNVPYSTVKHWKQGTRPDGKNDQIYGKISIQAVLPDEVAGKDKDGNFIMRKVDESDFAKATGIKPMPVDQFMLQLAGTDLEALAAHLGAERLKQLVDSLGKYLPPATDVRR